MNWKPLLLLVILFSFFACKKENQELPKPFVGKYKGTLSDTLYIDGEYHGVTITYTQGRIDYDSVAKQYIVEGLFFADKTEKEIIYMDESDNLFMSTDSFSTSGLNYQNYSVNGSGKVIGGRLLIRRRAEAVSNNSPLIIRSAFGDYVKIP